MKTMNLRLKLLAAGFFSLAAASCFATSGKAVEQLKTKLANTTAFRAQFSQEVSEAGQVIQRSRGNVYLKRPGRFRWLIRTPSEQLLVSNGRVLWVFDKDLEQVTIKQLEREINGTPALFLSGSDTKFIENYTVQQTTQGELNCFKLIPKSNKQTHYRAIELYFKKNALIKIKLMDHLGQMTIVKFTSIMKNPVLNDGLFEFKIPPGVDVIRQ